MCLIFFYINPSPQVGEYKVVLVNNRDETYSRPTKPAHFWDGTILGGMDMQEGREGGTWLAVSKEGKISCLLNVFQTSSSFLQDGASRGFLVVNYLKAGQTGQQYLEELNASEKVYNVFNLLTMDPEGDSYNVTFYNSQVKIPKELQPGFHGFGNCPIEKPFKKVEKGKRLLQDVVDSLGRKESEERLVAELFKMMQDTEPNFPDSQLSDQGKGYPTELIQSLSSVFVTSPGYGTRTTTVILVDHKNQLVYHERTMQEPVIPGVSEWKNSSFSFTTNS